MPSFNEHYGTVKTGEVAGATSATQLPNVPCRLAIFKALADNAGNVYLGASGVTKADGTSDATSGWQLDAGQETPPLPISNLNQLYRICDNTGDDIVYMAFD
jgi:hypothetical protein